MSPVCGLPVVSISGSEIYKEFNAKHCRQYKMDMSHLIQMAEKNDQVVLSVAYLVHELSDFLMYPMSRNHSRISIRFVEFENLLETFLERDLLLANDLHLPERHCN